MAILKKKLAIAVDLGATNLRVALVSSTGKILKKAKEETAKTGKDGSVVTNQIIHLIHEVAKEIDPRKVAGIGISSIGPLDYDKGGPLNSPNIPFSFIPLVKPLEKEFGLPVHLLNDANAAVLGEKYFGAGKRVTNLVYITISTGIGGGAIVDGKLLFGRGGNAAEIGHMIVDTTYNLSCTCRKGIGHWEALSSGTNLPRFFRVWQEHTDKKDIMQVQTAKEIFDLARRKNATALDFLDELAKVNARAISNIIVAYDPELITIGGSVALNNPEFLLPGIEAKIDHYLEMPRICVTNLGDDIVVLGAASSVFQK